MKRKYISNDAVFLEVKKMACAEGRGKGTDLFRVTNAAGLDFEVLIDRCMGIGALRVDGRLVSYTSETGIVHPAYYEKDGFGWLRSFGGGFLVTCGLTQVGEPCDGHGLHGRIDNTPAEQVGWKRWWQGDVLWAELSGTMYQVCNQGEHLCLRRTIRLRHDEKRIWLEDTVTNCGPVAQPFMLLYHINLGAPFLIPGTNVSFPNSRMQCFDKASEDCREFSKTIPDISAEPLDLLWLHHPLHNTQTQTVAVNNGRQTVTVTYPSKILPVLGQWELLARHGYVLALEPTNTHLQGQDWEKANGSLQWIAPEEEVSIPMTFSFG